MVILFVGCMEEAPEEMRNDRRIFEVRWFSRCIYSIPQSKLAVKEEKLNPRQSWATSLCPG